MRPTALVSLGVTVWLVLVKRTPIRSLCNCNNDKVGYESIQLSGMLWNSAVWIAVAVTR